MAGTVADRDASWGAVHKLFHWTIAVLVVLQLGTGFYRMTVEDRGFRDVLLGWHMNIGYALLTLMVLRLAWRLTHPVPPLPDTLRPVEKLLARANHYGLYLLVIAQSVIGWLTANSGRYTADIDVLLEFPRLVEQDRARKEVLEAFHFGLAIAIMVLVAVHVAAALRHHFLLRDDTLKRMLPFIR